MQFEQTSPPSQTLFLHPELALPDLRPAREWMPGPGGLCGVRANAHIIATYQELDASLLRYLGGTPYSTWLTFARYATREVGSWIRGAESFLCAFGNRSASPTAQLRALQRFVASAHADRLLDVIGQAILRMLNAARVSSTVLVDVRRLMSVWPRMTEMAWRIRSALVEGNTELYHRLGFAFDLFLRAESEGRNGLEALGEATADGRLDDSLGFIRAGFARYRRARQLGHARGAMLEASRRQLIHEANVLLALQEQALILQRPTIFEHPLLHEAFGAVKPGRLLLTLHPESRDGSFHYFPLLPNGGNWADFATRMGFREVSPEDGTRPGAVEIRFPDRPEERRHYVPDPSARGTILDLFTRYFEGPASEALRLGRPRDIHPAYVAA